MGPVAVVIGAGPGLGMAVARRLAREGYGVALVARRREVLDGYVRELLEDRDVVLGVPADAGDPASLESAWCAIVDDLGAPEVLVYNAAAFEPRGAPTTLEPADLQASLAVNVTGAMLAAKLAAPAMREAGRGTMLFTGGGLAFTPSARISALAIGKAAIRSLAYSLAEELAPDGIHVATVTVSGQVIPGTHFDPDTIAGVYWDLHREPAGQWRTEVVYD